MFLSSCSKTFLVGEYAVLFGGSAIVLSGLPKFQLYVNNESTNLIGIKQNSPAGLFFNSHVDVFKNISVRFFDPYSGAGGFGASSAQFVLLYKLYLKLTGSQFNIADFLDEYRSLATNNGIPPSGADCVCQFFDHNVFFDNKTYSVKTFDFDLPNLGLAIFKTSSKIPTHEHLKTLNANLDVSELQIHTMSVKEGIIAKNESQVVTGVNNFFKELCCKCLVLREIPELIDNIMRNDAILAAKGCGALSADTVLIIYEKSKKTQALSHAAQFGLSLVVER